MYFPFGRRRAPQPPPTNDLDKINKLLKDKSVKIILPENTGKIAAKIVQIYKDSISYIDTPTKVKMTIPTAKVFKIIMTSHGRGAEEGFMIGLLTGTAFFAGIKAIGSKGSDELGYSVGGFLAGAGVMLISPIIGGAYGSKEIYIFDEKATAYSEDDHRIRNMKPAQE